MKVAFVTMRYGREVIGGAEAFCRIIAEHMSKYWDVDVLTTDSIDHFTWEPNYETGKKREYGVNVIRFPIDQKKDLAHLGDLGKKLMAEKFRSQDELDWINTQGPLSEKMFKYIEKNQDKYDCFFFWGYLFAHTYYGLQIVPEKSVLIPFIHDEAFFYFKVYDPIFNGAKGIVFETPEEKELLLKNRSKVTQITEMIGTAIDIPPDLSKIKVESRFQIDDPYIIYVGRIEPAKGVNDLVNYFIQYKKDYPGDLKLVLVGNRNNSLPESDEVINVGPIYDDQKFVLMSNAKVLINPSPFESFSLVIAEAWLSGRPTLVNAACSVLEGQSKRANAGLWYRNYEEFASMLTILLENDLLREKMAENGKEYIVSNYTWPIVEEKYKRIAEQVTRKK